MLPPERDQKVKLGRKRVFAKEFTGPEVLEMPKVFKEEQL